MWEVVWTDPHQESVREHREKKAIQREQEQRDRNRAQHRSVSSRTSASSDNKGFGLFGSKSLKRAVGRRPKTSSAALLMAASENENKSRRVSYLSTAASATSAKQPSEVSSDGIQPSAPIAGPDQFVDSFQNSSGSSNRGKHMTMTQLFLQLTDSRILRLRLFQVD